MVSIMPKDVGFSPQKRTWFSTAAMSALCQKRTHALQQSNAVLQEMTILG
jgi:hypothetical protein